MTRLISEADQIGALLHARFVVVGALGLALHADDRLFLAMNLVGQAGDRRGGVRHGLLEARGLADQPLERRPSTRAIFSRSSLISRLVARMPRDSVLSPPVTT